MSSCGNGAIWSKPRNVRELESLMERLALVCDAPMNLEIAMVAFESCLFLNAAEARVED